MGYSLLIVHHVFISLPLCIVAMIDNHINARNRNIERTQTRQIVRKI